MNARFLVMLIVMLCAAACGSSSSDATPTDSGPRLIEEATLPPPTVTPLRLFTATVTVESASGATRTPTPVQTRSGFFLETPTPPNTSTPTVTDTPTRTPTLTPSRTPTPTRTNTPAPTATFTPSFTPSITPLPSITPQNFVAAQSPNCPFEWFFSPAPSGCPLTNALTSSAAFQPMEGGFMIWVQSGQTIFVLYESDGWLFAPDTFEEGEFLSNDGFLPPPGLLMPQRGFGKLWLNDAEVRTRLGWAVSPEVGYAATIQAEATTGRRYVSGPDGEVYLLENDGADWQRLR